MSHGDFVWYELATTDPDGAAAFYKDVIGWDVRPFPEMHYTIFETGGARVAGMMQLPEEVRAKGVPPHWVGYIHVDDVDTYAKRAEGAGATLRHGPADIPGVGRFAVLTDPDGAPFDLFKPDGEGGPEVAAMTPGHVGWHELKAASGDAAF